MQMMAKTGSMFIAMMFVSENTQEAMVREVVEFKGVCEG
jgi:hypothetical protein